MRSVRSSPAPPESSAARALGATFSDPALQRRFERDGYAVLPGLDADDLAAFRSVWEQIQDGTSDGFRSDVIGRSPEAGALIERELGPTWDRLIERDLVDHRRFLVSFLTKWPGEGSQLDLHQDWTYADERSDRTVSFWIALDDCSAELGNGPLYVIPGSHDLVDAYRGPAVTDWFGDLRQQLADHLVPIDVRAGDAVILDNALLHESPPNRTDAPRRAIAAAVAPTQARFLFAAPGDADEVVLVDLGPEYLPGYDPDDPSIAHLPVVGRAPRLIAVAHERLEALVGPLPDDLASGPPSKRDPEAAPLARTLEHQHALIADEHRRARTAGRLPAPAPFLLDWAAGAPAASSVVPLLDGTTPTEIATVAYPGTADLLVASAASRASIVEIPAGAAWSLDPHPHGHVRHALLLEGPRPVGTTRLLAPGRPPILELGRVASGLTLAVENHGRSPASVVVVDAPARRVHRAEQLMARGRSRRAVRAADEVVAAVNPHLDRRPRGEGARP